MIKNNAMAILLLLFVSGCASNTTNVAQPPAAQIPMPAPVKLKAPLYAKLEKTPVGYRFSSFTADWSLASSGSGPYVDLSKMRPMFLIDATDCVTDEYAIRRYPRCSKPREEYFEKTDFNQGAAFALSLISNGSDGSLARTHMVLDEPRFALALREAISQLAPGELSSTSDKIALIQSDFDGNLDRISAEGDDIRLWYKTALNLSTTMTDATGFLPVVIFSLTEKELTAVFSPLPELGKAGLSKKLLSDKAHSNSLSALAVSIEQRAIVLANQVREGHLAKLRADSSFVEIHCSHNATRVDGRGINFDLSVACPSHSPLSVVEGKTQRLVIPAIVTKARFRAAVPKTSYSDQFFQVAVSNGDIVLRNLTDKFLNVDSLSVYYGKKIETLKITEELPPNGEKIIAFSSFSAALYALSWEFSSIKMAQDEKLDFGVAAKYRVVETGTEKTLFKKTTYSKYEMLNSAGLLEWTPEARH